MESNQYKPPVRKSLTDEELNARVEYATSTKMGIEAMMDLVVAQEALRAQEDLEIEKWLEEMEAEGSPESLRAAENFRRSQTGLPEIPKVEVQEEPAEQPAPFTWFTQPEPVIEEPAVEEVVEEPFVEEIIEIEIVEEVAEIDFADEPSLVEEVPSGQEEIQGWSIVSDPVLEAVGSETPDEFEHLLASAAAEEELTALEELDSESKTDEVVEEESTGNTLIPSDEHRNRKPVSQLLVWLGASATLVPVILTWLLISFGLSATAVVLDLVVGYLVAGVLISTAALAGKRSGLSTSIVARAIFGVWGNAIPGTFVFVIRAFVAALLLALTVLLFTGVDSSLPDFTATVTSIGSLNVSAGLTSAVIALFVVAMIALVRGLTARVIQIVLSSAAFAATLVALVGSLSNGFNFVTPGSSEFGSKASILGLALVVLVSSVLFVAIAPNLAKAIPMRERGIRVFGWVAIANFIAPVLIGLVALNWFGPRASQLALIMPLDLHTMTQIVWELPQYSRISLLVAVAVTLLYTLLLTVKTATLDLTSLMQIKSRVVGLLLSVVVAVIALVIFALQPVKGQLEYLVNVFILLSALSAGWVGMLVTDVALRRIAYHELSLSRSYGFYKRFSLLSVLAWILSLTAALAVMPINLKGFSFTGFASESLGLDKNLSSAPVGFLIAVAVGVVLTFALRIPEIRKQEKEVLAVEARREQLNNIFLGQE